MSETVAVAASIVHMFTGNNIGPRGDLASRNLGVRLEIDRADPENRTFKHPDPVAWTDAHRGEILQNLYTVLLANPDSAPGSNATPETRFKMWWRLVGSAIEYAAEQLDHPLKFRDLFLEQEADDEESSDALRALDAQWPIGQPFHASELARMLNNISFDLSDDYRERQASLREFLFPAAPPNLTITAKSAGKRLHQHVGNPVRNGARTLVLKAWRDATAGPKGALAYFVDAKTG